MSDRKLDVSRAITQPTRVRTWAEVPEALRKYETLVAEYELMTTLRLDPDLRISGMLSTLPAGLEDRVLTQANLLRTYPTMKEYVLGQVARARTQRRGTVQTTGTKDPTDVAHLTGDTDESVLEAGPDDEEAMAVQGKGGGHGGAG